MYKAFYSLSTFPFSKEIHVNNLFSSDSLKEAMARLEYLKNTRGIGVMVGEPGAGKTFILRAFTKKLNPSLYKVIYFPLSTGTVTDFYRGLAFGLGEEPCFRKVDLFQQIQQAVYSSFHEKKVTPVFLMDEMHMASNRFLNDLSILFNFKLDSENPFIVILAGLPFLMDRLSLNQNQSLAQRVVMRYKFTPLNKEEVKAYVKHHLELAGANYDIFSATAIEALASRSRGWPRLINSLAVNSLLLGYQLKVETIDEDIVFKACEEAGL
ncbi:MAG: AAA family ATPase [Candidatus Syntrophonatronum acetioxidans]|uniref:AAA family ATPase n=1 Tax=Candidatus Syntrophonatronum acetioxidans TaxID=1795816 RepID=A0A424YEG6_9FIRM|nr:MAG: AAA family ATPase [Candidatus Syntrophonatronum acetioxidans]